jgi:HD-like signal output (HDOD) protein
MTTLPSLPEVYQTLMQTIDGNTSAEQIGAVISQDMAMTTKVLQLANSAFFGVSRHISDPSEATVYLGVETMKALVLTIGVFSQFRGRGLASLPMSALQRHSLDTARIAQAIANHENVGKQIAADAFLAGLLHNVGRLILVTHDPEAYGRVIARMDHGKVSLEPLEREAFGASHSEVGSYLLLLWGLPQAVTEAVAFHHCPSECPPQGLNAVALLHFANVLAITDEASGPDLNRAQPDEENLDEAYLADIGFAGRLPVWRALARETLSAAGGL